MANKHRGEVELVVGAKTYTLRLSLHAIATLEEWLGAGVDQAFARLQDPSAPKLRTIIQIFRAALIQHHPEVTESEAADLILDAGLEEATVAITAAAEFAMEKMNGGKAGVPASGPPSAPPTSPAS